MNKSTNLSAARPRVEPRTLRDLTTQQWKSGVAAWLGWMFDGLDMHLYTLVAAPFVAELLGIVCATSLTAHWAFMFWYQQHLRNLPDLALWSAEEKNRFVSIAMFVVMIAGCDRAGAKDFREIREVFTLGGA